MNNDDIKMTLFENGIGFQEISGRIMADEVYKVKVNGGYEAGCMQVDVTGFTKLELKIWLGFNERSKK